MVVCLGLMFWCFRLPRWVLCGDWLVISGWFVSLVVAVVYWLVVWICCFGGCVLIVWV